MTTPDVPPVTTPHSSEIIRDNFPPTSESGTVQSVIAFFQKAAESVGTGNTAETMFALIEAHATGQTPTELLSDFTSDQRAAFDLALRSLNQGQGASVMAQDILNAKVQLNGVATTFEAAVEELIASYAASGGPSSPKNQGEFQQKYQELLEQAQKDADSIGKNHKSTQEQLIAGVQKGGTPQVPSTMAPTSSSNPTVPGMPDGAMGSMLQNVAGQMMKPPNLPMPNIGQMAQPMVQSAQSAIKELMQGNKGGNVPITEDALKKLSTSAGLSTQNASLSNARKLDGPEGDENGANSPLSRSAGLPKSATVEAGARHAAPDAAHSNEPDGSPQSAPTAPANTAAPVASTPTTTLSSGSAATGPDPLTPSAQTHVSSGDPGAGGSTLGTSAQAPVQTAATAPPGGMMPITPGMGVAPASGAGGSTGGAARSDRSKIPGYRPDLSDPDAALSDFGAGLKGLDHATDQQHIAASIAAGLVRMHQRAGVDTKVAVGIGGSQAVFATSDGLGFLARGIKAQPNLTPLITQVPDAFVGRWIGCDQPWRPLLDAVATGLVKPFDSVVCTDPSAQQHDVLVLGERELAAVNIIPGSQNRSTVDAVDPEDIDAVVKFLSSSWGQPVPSASDLETRAWTLRWVGEDVGDRPLRYATVWVHYLLAAAMVDLQVGDIDSARYMLRNALRVPVPAQVAR